jgi:formate-dependent phosphoribosylglycinamide formyltransferase (GAR transformylase)
MPPDRIHTALLSQTLTQEALHRSAFAGLVFWQFRDAIRAYSHVNESKYVSSSIDFRFLPGSMTEAATPP